MRKSKTHSNSRWLGDEKGFTLIEMAIVLIIIGIILGAIVKGKDVVKSAEQKRLYSSFVREWQMEFNNYYDRTGWVLGDDDSDDNTSRDGLCGDGGTLASATNLNNQLLKVGLTPPSEGSTGATNIRTYTDSTGRQFALTLRFANNATFGNFIQITSTNGAPFDLGRAWDRIVDGTLGSNQGDLVYVPDVAGAPTVAAATWPDADAASVAASGIYLRLEF